MADFDATVVRMYSGERILPRNIFNVTYQQSLLAYEVAATYVTGKSVLDVACGEGYGLSLLAKSAKRAVGVDYDATTINEANRQYGSQSLEFIQGNLFSLPNILKGETFDVVCCFQTIEHVEDHAAFLTALRAVTKPNGKIIVSTPNTKKFHSFNPYHVHEVDVHEWRDLFTRHFTVFTLLGVFGDEAVRRYREGKQKISDAVLRLDFLRAREWLPGWLLTAVYAFVSFFVIKRISLWRHYKDVTSLTTKNFSVREDSLGEALDFIAVATVDERDPVVPTSGPQHVTSPLWLRRLGWIVFLSCLFIPRTFALEEFFIQDEQPWMDRSQVYWNALSHGDFAEAVKYPLSNHPAIPLMTVVGPVLNMYSWYYDLSGTYTEWSWSTRQDAATIARYGWGLACSLMLLLVFLMARRLVIFQGKEWAAAILVLLLGFEPWVWGITRSVSVDVMIGIGLVGSFIAAGLARQYRTPIWFFLSGAWWGLAFVSKSPALITVPFIVALVMLMSPFVWQALLKRAGLWLVGVYVAMVVIWPPFLLHPWQRLTDVLARAELHSTVQETYILSDTVLPFFVMALSAFAFIGCVLYVLLRFIRRQESWASLLLFDALLLAGVWHGLVLVVLHGDHARKNLPALALLATVGAMGWLLLLQRMRLSTWRWGTALIVIQLLLVGSYFPHVMTAHNFVLMSPEGKRMLVDVGSGSRLLADYILSRDESLVWSVPMDSLIMPYLPSQVRSRVRELPPDGTFSNLAADVTHVVVPASFPARVRFDSNAEQLLKETAPLTPEKTLSIRDVPMFWVYRVTP